MPTSISSSALFGDTAFLTPQSWHGQRNCLGSNTGVEAHESLKLSPLSTVNNEASCCVVAWEAG